MPQAAMARAQPMSAARTTGAAKTDGSREQVSLVADRA
jgi:hypothetical protein